MERGYVPSIWDIQPGGSSSQLQDDARASERTVPGSMEDSNYNTNTLGEHERRKKLTQAYGRSLLSALQSSQLPPSSSTNPNLMVPSAQVPPPSVQIPPPATRISPSSVDESSKRSNPFPIEFGRKRDERPKQESPKPHVSSSTVPSIPVHNVGSSTPVSPVNDLNAIRQQIMLAGMNALAMNNPSLQAQLLLGQNNSAILNNPSLQAQLLLGHTNSAVFNDPLRQAQLLLGQNNASDNLPFLGVNMKSSVPDGSGLSKYHAPNMDSLTFDHEAGYRFDPTTGLHYDANSGLFINLALKTFLRWDSILNTYLRVDSPGSGQASGVGPISQNSVPVISQIPRSALSKMNIQPTGIPEAIQSQATYLLSNPINPSSSVPSVQDSFMNEIWQRMRALAKEAMVDSQSSQNPGEAVRMKNEKLPDERHDSENADGDRRVKPKPSSSSRSRSASLDDRRKGRGTRRTSRSRSSSHSVDFTQRRTGRKRSRSRSKGAGRSPYSRSPVRNRRRSRSRGARRNHSKGRSTHSRSPARNRRRSRSRGARRSRSRGRRSISRGRKSRSRGRRSISRGRKSRSRGRRSTSRARKSRSRGHRRSVSRSPGRGRSARRSRSRGAKRNRRSRSGNRRSCSRRRRSLSRGTRGSRSTRRIISRSPVRPSHYTRFVKRDIPKNKRELKRKEGPSFPPNRQHFSSTDDDTTGGAVAEDISNPALGKNIKKKKRGGKKQRNSNLTPLSSSAEDGGKNQGDSDSLSDFDFLKETLDDDNESVVVDEYEEALEHDESIFENESPELKEDQTVDLGDVLGHLFPNDEHTFNNIILVAPVPLRDDSRNAKDLKNQIGDQEDALKIHVFNKATGSPCHYMLIFFRTTEAATQWYNSNNGSIILKSDDGSKMRGYLNFAESGNWTCSNCKRGNFLMRILCCKCYQAKGNQHSPITVAKEPTKYVGIAKLKSCFQTTESVLDSLPSLDMFDIHNVQMMTEPRNLPMGLCVFEVQSEAEGTRLYAFFRQHGRASIYVMMNEKKSDSNAEENIDTNPHQQNPHCTGYERHDEEDSLALLFTNETPKNVILVAPIPISKTLKRTKSELSLTESYLITSLDDDGVKYDDITLHIDKNVGAPCSYGLIIFSDSETATKWREKHDNSLNINITGWKFPTSADTEQSLKVFLHFGENNWECQNCHTSNFFLRSLCHKCFFFRNGNVPGPIIESAMTSRWVATSRLTDWFTGNECIVTELKKVMKDLKLARIFVLRDPKIPLLPLGCVFETESWGDSLRLREFLHRTGWQSTFVTTNRSFDEFTGTALITIEGIPKQTVSCESTFAVVNDPCSINTPSEVTELIHATQPANPTTAETETSNLSDTDDISELEPDKCCKNHLLWWSQDSVRYSDILNDLFMHNPLTRVSPGQTIFIGPLPNSLYCTETKSSAFQKILTDKLEQDNLPFSAITIHTGPFCGAPCTFGLVCFNKPQDAAAWHDKHKSGLILPRPQPIQKTHKPLPKENKLFKTFVYFCKTNWRCRSCSKFNFGLRSHCFTCLAAKEPGQTIITFSNTPTNCVCIRKFKSWAVTEELLVAHNPFLKKHSNLFSFKVLKERSGVPSGTCILETNNTSDAQLLFNHLRATEGKKVVRYGILPVPEGVIMASNSDNTIDCEDGFKEMFDDDSPSKILFMGPVPGLAIFAESFYKELVTKEGADCEKVECCLAETVGASHGYCLVHFNTLELATDWYRKCQGRVILTRRALLDGKFEAINPVNAFLHFTENNWSCDCGSQNFPVRSICFKCYKERNAESAPFIISSTPTKWLGVRLTNQWYPTTDKALCLSRKIYNQSRIGSIRLYNDPKIPRDFFAMYVIETLSVEGAQLLLDFYKSSRIARVTHFVDFKNIGPDNVTSLGAEVAIQQMNCGNIPKPKSASNSGSLGRVPPAMVNKEVLVCPDHETILWTSLFESRLNNPPASVVMISLCPGDRELPAEARSQILNSLQEAGANHQSILYSFKGDVGSPFSYCLVSFGSIDSAKTWVDKCNGNFQFNVPCPDDTTTPPNFQNFYSLKSSSSVDNTYSIKSKLNYSTSNWLCSCGTANFPLRSLCHECFKNRDRESDYESIPDASSFVGIKLSEYKNLFDSNPISELRKSGHRILKIATCFDPALPRDPCGVVILEAQSIEFGTKLYNFLCEKNGLNRKDQNCKRLMMLLEKSSGIAYFKCPKSLEPNWKFCASQNWDSYFVNEISNIITVDMDILGNFKFDIPLEQYGGRLKKYRNSTGFIPGFCLIYFPTPQAAKEWYDANKGKLKNPITSAVHSLHYTMNFWQCPKCSAPNFPARVLCHRCYRHKMEEFSPVRMSKWPTRWVGITKDSYQKQAVASLVEDCRQEDENFQLRSIDIFFDPNVRQDGICIFVFEVSSLVEGLQLKNFFDKRCVKCSFFELVQQSQVLAEILEASTESDKLQGEVSEETVNASELEFSDVMLNSNQSPDRESNSSTVNPMVEDCVDDSKLADPPADTETAIKQSEGLSLESFFQLGMSDEKVEKLAPKIMCKEHAELSIQKNLSLNNESQQGSSEAGASQEIQLSSNAEVDPASDQCAAPNESCVDSKYRNFEIIPMDTFEPTTLEEDQNSIIADADPSEPSNKSKSSDDGNTPKINPAHTGNFFPDDGNELHPSCDDSCKDSSAGDVGMVDPISDSCMDIDSQNPKIISEPFSVQKLYEAEVDLALEERVTPRESCLNSDSQNVEIVPMNISDPQTFPDDRTSSKSEVNPGLKASASLQSEVNPGLEVCASPMESSLDSESQNVKSIPANTYETEALMEDHESKVDASVEVCPIPSKPCITESQESTSNIVDADPSNSSQSSDGQKAPRENLEHKHILDGDDLKDLSAVEAGMVNPTSGPSWIPGYPASAFVIGAPLTPRPSVNPNKDFPTQISKILTNDQADFKGVFVHKSLESGAPWHYSIVHFASADSAKTWLEKRGRQMKLKQGARVRKDLTVHLYFGKDDWVCACGITNYFERTFCHGCFRLKTGAGFSTIMQSTIPSLWVAIRPSNSAKNVDMYVKNWMLNLRKAGLTFVTEPTFHSDPGIKGGDMYGVYIFKNSTLEESEKLLTWFNAKHRAMYVTPYVPSSSN